MHCRKLFIGIAAIRTLGRSGLVILSDEVLTVGGLPATYPQHTPLDRKKLEGAAHARLNR